MSSREKEIPVLSRGVGRRTRQDLTRRGGLTSLVEVCLLFIGKTIVRLPASKGLLSHLNSAVAIRGKLLTPDFKVDISRQVVENKDPP